LALSLIFQAAGQTRETARQGKGFFAARRSMAAAPCDARRDKPARGAAETEIASKV